jgi:hypothetical protein
MGTGETFPGVKVAGTWNWLLTSILPRSRMVELYIHPHIRLHDTVLKQVSTSTFYTTLYTFITAAVRASSHTIIFRACVSVHCTGVVGIPDSSSERPFWNFAGEISCPDWRIVCFFSHSSKCRRLSLQIRPRPLPSTSFPSNPPVIWRRVLWTIGTLNNKQQINNIYNMTSIFTWLNLHKPGVTYARGVSHYKIKWPIYLPELRELWHYTPAILTS